MILEKQLKEIDRLRATSKNRILDFLVEITDRGGWASHLYKSFR
jgi:hypothetical protein